MFSDDDFTKVCGELFETLEWVYYSVMTVVQRQLTNDPDFANVGDSKMGHWNYPFGDYVE